MDNEEGLEGERLIFLVNDGSPLGIFYTNYLTHSCFFNEEGG